MPIVNKIIRWRPTDKLCEVCGEAVESVEEGQDDNFCDIHRGEICDECGLVHSKENDVMSIKEEIN